MNSNRTRKMVLSSMIIAIGVLLGKFSIPIGVSKVFPFQHLINVLSAVILGPTYAVINAFTISLLRNLLGIGSLLSFPGSMIGALISGLFYKVFKNIYFAAFGEILGTGLIGGLISFPIAKFFMGSSVGALFFVPIFLMSSITGAVLAVLLLKVAPSILTRTKVAEYEKSK